MPRGTKTKRQVKAPKVYIRDSGILHALLDIGTMQALECHPKLGSSWEGVCIESIIGQLGARPDQCYYWATHAGAELDLLVMAGGRRRGFEFKRTVAPKVTPSMQVALHDLKLDSLDVIHAGRDTFPLAKTIRAVSLRQLNGIADV